MAAGLIKNMRTIFPSTVDTTVNITEVVPQRVFYRTSAANYTAIPWDYIGVDTSAGPVQVTLPPASANPNVTITIIKISNDTNSVTVIGAGADTVIFDTEKDFSFQGTAMDLVSDGVSNWLPF